MKMITVLSNLRVYIYSAMVEKLNIITLFLNMNYSKFEFAKVRSLFKI